MLRTRRVVLFVVGVCVLFTLLSLPWPGVRTSYMTAFRGVGNALIKEHTFGDGGRAGFLPPDPAQPAADQPSSPWHTHILIANMPAGVGQRIALSVRNHGYVPTITLVALTLMTPLPWWRRVVSLVGGLVLLHVLIAIRVLLPIVATLADPGPHAVYDLGPTVQALLEWLLNVFVHPPGNSYILPLLVWLVVAFRLRDWYTPATPERAPREPQSS